MAQPANQDDRKEQFKSNALNRRAAQYGTTLQMCVIQAQPLSEKQITFECAEVMSSILKAIESGKTKLRLDYTPYGILEGPQHWKQKNKQPEEIPEEVDPENTVDSIVDQAYVPQVEFTDDGGVESEVEGSFHSKDVDVIYVTAPGGYKFRFKFSFEWELVYDSSLDTGNYTVSRRFLVSITEIEIFRVFIFCEYYNIQPRINRTSLFVRNSSL